MPCLESVYIAYDDDCATEVSWLCLLAAYFWGTGKKALPFTGLRPSFPSICPSVGAVAADGTMAAATATATAVVVSPAMCDAALEAGYFSGYAALPFLSSQRLASNNLQRLAALQSPHVLSWHSMVRRRRAQRRYSCGLGNANRGHGSIKERRKRMLGRARAPWKCCTTTTHGTGHTGKRLKLYRIRALLPQAHWGCRRAGGTAGTTVSPGARRAHRGCCYCLLVLHWCTRQAGTSWACCLVTDFDGLCSNHESSTVSVVSAEFLRSGSRVLKAQQR